MAIQPIDLQTMYSQMSNVANKVASEQQGAQMNASLQQQAAVLQNAKELNSVKKAASEESKTGLIKEDGKKNNENQSKKKQNNASDNNSNLEEDVEPKTEIRESYLGNHINITR